MSVPIALTIAGSDSSGGAGIQADLKTFSALGVYGASVVTALTAQNTKGVFAIHEAPPDFIAAQMDAVFSDLDVSAVKIGMLGSAAAIAAVAGGLRRPVVVAIRRADGLRPLSAGHGLFRPAGSAVDDQLPRGGSGRTSRDVAHGRLQRHRQDRDLGTRQVWLGYRPRRQQN